jgi:hypothetical protein
MNKKYYFFFKKKKRKGKKNLYSLFNKASRIEAMHTSAFPIVKVFFLEKVKIFVKK